MKNAAGIYTVKLNDLCKLCGAVIWVTILLAHKVGHAPRMRVVIRVQRTALDLDVGRLRDRAKGNISTFLKVPGISTGLLNS